MTPKMKRNLLVAPLAILVRAPILLPLLLVAKVGTLAEMAMDWLWPRLPGFKR